MKNTIRGALALLVLAAPLHASALCTVLCACSASTTSVSFGVYNPLSGSPLDSTGNVRVTCGGVAGLLVPYQIALGKGANSSNFSPRKTASGANRLNYDLYTDPAHASIWGDGINEGTQTVSGFITIILLGPTPQDHTIYGRIPGGQTTVSPGSYSDAVVVTVTYQ
jgi:spore coat protein U-like protein